MKTIIFLIASLLLFSCEERRDNDYYNPKYLIRVNFSTKQAWEGSERLELAPDRAVEICSKIIRKEILPEQYKYNILCMGGNEKSVHFVYLQLDGSEYSGTYLVEFDDAKILVHKINSYKPSECGLKWILSEN
jgi:hypothetical protein